MEPTIVRQVREWSESALQVSMPDFDVDESGSCECCPGARKPARDLTRGSGIFIADILGASRCAAYLGVEMDSVGQFDCAVSKHGGNWRLA